MKKEQVNKFYSWFNMYFDSFEYDDEKINANLICKKLHTFRVCENIVSIAKSLNLSDEKTNLAEVIGLFHDVGRFEQFAEYKTFKDGISVDHGDLSVSILEKYDVLKDIQTEEKNMILKSIEYHNKRTLPKGLGDECLLFCRLIRDADKLDIFHLLVDFYENPHLYEYEAFEDYPNPNEYQSSFVENIMNARQISYNDVKTRADVKLLRISWVYDIYFNSTLAIINHNKYIDRIIKFLPDTEDIRGVQEHISSYISGRLGNLL